MNKLEETYVKYPVIVINVVLEYLGKQPYKEVKDLVTLLTGKGVVEVKENENAERSSNHS